jgi:FdhE protein
MTPHPATRRIARARLLAERHPDAADLLRFYAGLAEQQAALIDTPAGLMEEARVLAAVPALLEWLARAAPAALAGEARQLRGLDDRAWHRWLEAAFVDRLADLSPHDAAALFVVETLVQASAERAAPSSAPEGVVTASDRDARRCPVCGRDPVVGVLREEGHGARRGLVCARCHTEWTIERVVCVACGEREFDKLPVFTAEQFPHIRVEACERCRCYLKTVDLTKDGLAIPVVDDLASPSLDLWARDQGYVRIRSNLLRT